ncbi:P-type conjugative transfer protein TrbG [Caulobacter sp. CCH5-E12]|uniref:P-type conjugative transfer protein TrbG n=1 Tax=Caulobacter sp. CCH5-E12 TaxID=1768770 RepID=UPI0007830461|nr:P-type conjugative transfer protein TrbG [Caulobacter sp. CCH5-E12]
MNRSSLATVLASLVASAMAAGAAAATAGPSGSRLAPGLSPPIPAAQARASQPVAMKPVPNPPERRAKPVRPRTVRRPAGAAAQANAQARDWPSSAAYVNSALFYDFEPGRIYTIQTSPRFLTTIQLRPGEKLIAKAAGDTVRWVLGETMAGAGDAAQVTVFVKPIRPGLRTNIVLTTDQRTYLIDATSNAAAGYTSVLAWNYPQEEARALAAERQQALASASARVAPDVPVDRLNFRYHIAARDRRAPAWTPVRVFDDGQKTYIEFPADLATRSAPPLFLLGEKDRAELVNYRQTGVYYVVDRLIDRAELRLGERRQDVVRITREGGGR